MRLILLRHGRDQQDRSAGAQNGDLTRAGIEQVANTAQKLRSLGIDAIDVALHSRTRRSKQTCDELNRTAPAKKIMATSIVDPGAGTAAIIEQLKAFSAAPFATVLISGHEPQLSRILLELAGTKPETIDERIPVMLLARGDAAVVDWDFDEVLDLRQTVYTRHLPAARAAQRPARQQAI